LLDRKKPSGNIYSHFVFKLVIRTFVKKPMFHGQQEKTPLWLRLQGSGTGKVQVKEMAETIPSIESLRS